MIRDCDLVARVKWITDAVSDKDMGTGALSSYLIRNGNIHAADGRMVVATPFPFEGPECLVPAEPFENVLINRPEGDFTWDRELDRLVLKRGRFKGRIKTLPIDSWVQPTDLPVGLTDIPDGLVHGLTQLLPFVSENATKPWATCFALVGGCMYASNNIAVARVPFECGIPGEYLIPCWVGEFIIKRAEGLVAWACEEQRITFLWEDGSWMRSSLIVDKYPPVKPVLDKFFAGQEVDVEITPAWRKALRRIGKIAEDAVVRLRPDECAGSTGEVLSVEDDAGAPVPEGLTETVWDIRYLEPVVAVATHWNPRLYPNPAPWRGVGIEGIIAGRRD